MAESRISELEYVCALDLETSGLDEQGDQVLEVAAVFGRIRNDMFVERERTQAALPLTTDHMHWHPVVREMHTKNGLLAEAAELRGALVSDNAVQTYLNGIDLHLADLAGDLPEGAKVTLLGNSVHFDLRFVRRYFPRFTKKLSHRVIDVSSIRMFCEALGMPYEKGEAAHRAMLDVEGALREFAKYFAFAERPERQLEDF